MPFYLTSGFISLIYMPKISSSLKNIYDGRV